MIPLSAAPHDLPVLDGAHGDALVALIFADDRPPKGLAGLIDWRTDGAISRMTARGAISGELDECVLFTAGNRTACAFMLFFGLGRRRDLTIERFRRTCSTVAAKLVKAGVRRFSFGLPPMDDARVSFNEALSLWLDEMAVAGPWAGITIIEDIERVRRFGWAMPEGLKRKVQIVP